MRFFILIIFIYFTWPFAYSQETHATTVREWSAKVAEIENKRMANKYDIDYKKLTNYTDLRSLVFINSSSPEVPTQLKGLDHLRLLLIREVIPFLRHIDQQEINSMFQSNEDDLPERKLEHLLVLFNNFEIDSKEYNNHLSLIKKWQNVRELRTLRGMACASLICRPGAEKDEVRAIRNAFRLMAPFTLTNQTTMSYLSLFEEILSDPIYQIFSLKLAQKLLKRITESRGQGKVEGNLYDDCLGIWQELNIVGKSAHDKTINYLGAWSTRGVDLLGVFPTNWHRSKSLYSLGEGRSLILNSAILNSFIGITAGVILDSGFYGFQTGISSFVMTAPFLTTAQSFPGELFVERSLFPTYANMSVIAYAITLLDAQSSYQSGYLYSMPKKILSSHTYFREYHFWLAAALSRDLYRKGHSPRATFESVYRLGLLYEVMADNIQTVDHQLIGKNDAYTGEALKDVVFHGAGALWGLEKELGVDNGPVDIDEIFVHYLSMDRHGSNIEKITDVFGSFPIFLKPLMDSLLKMPNLLRKLNAMDPFYLVKQWSRRISLLSEIDMNMNMNMNKGKRKMENCLGLFFVLSNRV